VSLAHAGDPIVGAARSLSGVGTTTGGWISVADAVDWVSVQLNVTAKGGTTPVLTASIEWSMNAGTTAATADTADAFTAISNTTGVFIKRFTVKAPYMRISEALAGTSPTMTYTPTYYTR
jgi:hypothetical protein